MQVEAATKILSEVSAPVIDDVNMMMTRSSDFPSPLVALLSAIGSQEKARHHMDDLLAEEWGKQWKVPKVTADEVVIGSGPHALIYAAVRASKGVKVIILEKSERAGGAFACSKGPSFRLNSRNRPGPLGLPGEGRGLNVLPGCLLQPSMVSGDEYQTNDQMAWAIRANLMLLDGVEVHTGVQVSRIRKRRTSEGGWYDVEFKAENTRAEKIAAKRVVIATGLGAAKKFSDGTPQQSDRAISFDQFMAQMDSPFPLRGMRRVAVVGAGDSGKTAIEALLGQGPKTGMSVSAIDFPEKIDWFGCPWTNQSDFCNANRGRYNRIGKALGTRIKALTKLETTRPTAGFESVQLGPRIYDWVVNCTGYEDQVPMFGGADYGPIAIGERVVARRVTLGNREDEVYRIGPAARLDLLDKDRRIAPILSTIPQNATSMFRYAPMTAAFAASLGTPPSE